MSNGFVQRVASIKVLLGNLKFTNILRTFCLIIFSSQLGWIFSLIASFPGKSSPHSVSVGGVEEIGRDRWSSGEEIDLSGGCSEQDPHLQHCPKF